jgi:hypothetical protein
MLSAESAGRHEASEAAHTSYRSLDPPMVLFQSIIIERIGFRSLTEALDTTTAQGRLVFHMFGALAEFERSLIRERTQAGLAAARRAGRTGGRPPKLTADDIEAVGLWMRLRHQDRCPAASRIRCAISSG